MKKKICAAVLSISILSSFAANFAYAKDDISIIVAGEEIICDSSPVIINDSVFIPLRAVSESLKAQVEWKSDTNTAVISKGVSSAELTTGSENAVINNSQHTLSAAPVIKNGRMMVPLRVISDALGYSIEWDGDTKTVLISDAEGKKTETEAPIIPDVVDPDEVYAGLEKDNIMYDNERFLSGRLDGNAELEVIDVEGQSFNKAIRVKVDKKPQNAYSIKWVVPANGSVKVGDLILVKFSVRTISAINDENSASTSLVWEYNFSPYKKLVTLPYMTGKEWQTFYKSFTATKEMTQEQTKLGFNCGDYVQEFEMGGLEVINFGQNGKYSSVDMPKTKFKPYEGMELDAAWRKDADERIEKYRKGDFKVQVSDENGEILKNAPVNVDLSRLDFDLGGLLYSGPASGKNPAQAYEQFKKYFNTGVIGNDMKWPQWENSNANAVDTINWFNENNIAARGHTLVWDSPSHMPSDLNDIYLNGTKEQFQKRVKEHIFDEVGTLKGKIKEWDVLNEAVRNLVFRSKWGPDMIKDWFAWAREADPNAKLYYNETGIDGQSMEQLSSCKEILDYMVKNDVDFDCIGIQGHFSTPVNPVNFYNQIEELAKYGKEIKITEYSMSSDECIKANWTRDMLTLAFSHPLVNGFVMWGQWEGVDQSNMNAPLLDSQWNLKAAGEQYAYLTKEKWHTNEKLTTDENGMINFRGFYGDYDVIITGEDGKKYHQTVSLKKDSPRTASVGLDGAEVYDEAAIAEEQVLEAEKNGVVDISKHNWKTISKQSFDDLYKVPFNIAGISGFSNSNICLKFFNDINGTDGNCLEIKGRKESYHNIVIKNLIPDSTENTSKLYKISCYLKLPKDCNVDAAYLYTPVSNTNNKVCYNSGDLTLNMKKKVTKKEWTKLEFAFYTNGRSENGVVVSQILKEDYDKIASGFLIDNIEVSEAAD